MTFFYDLNKKLASISALEQAQTLTESVAESTGDYSAKKARAGKDIGKPGKNFDKIAKSAGQRYGSKAAGERVAGAVLNKLRHAKESVAEEYGPMEAAAAATEKPAAVIKRVLGPALDWEPGQSKMYKNTRRSRTERVDDYAMKYVRIKMNFGPQLYLSSDPARPVVSAVNLKNKLIKAGYPVHGDLLIFPDQISFQVRTPITTTAESGVAEGSSNVGDTIRELYQQIYDQGDDALEYLNTSAPLFAQFWDQYEGDLDSIIAEVSPKNLIRIAKELQAVADQEGVAEGSEPMTAKQKEFAALAEPKDKITFADKIAGAKKEVDEVLGDVAADAMKKAISGHGTNAKPASKEGRIDDLMDKRREAEREHGAKAPKAKAGVRFVAGKAYGGSAQQDEPEDDDETTSTQSDQPKKRGRPKGTGRKLGAKGPSGKSKLLTREDMPPGAMSGDEGEYGNEGDMAKDQIHTIVRNARDLEKVLANNEDLPEWVQSKLAKIEGMMTAVSDYIQTQHERGAENDTGEEGVELDEKAVSKAQRKAAGIAHAAQKGEIPKSELRGASKEMAKMSRGELHKFAATKEKGLPEKKAKEPKKADKKDKVKEETPETPAKGSAGFAFGKGIYDSMNRDVERLIAESMSVNMSNSTEGGQSLTVTATDEDALQLAKILQAAGLAHGGMSDSASSETCDTCGMKDCGCGDVHEALDENQPDWPTDTETSDNALQYSGGLNKPKTTVAGDGQTTVPVTAVQVRESEQDLDEQEQVMAPEAEELDESKCNECGMYEAECKCDENVAESLARIRELAGMQESKKPDFLDVDKDGDKEEPMTKAIDDKEKKVEESIFALTNQWRAYKG